MNFSVVIPTHNRPQLIQRAIASAVKNLIDGDEILVIDDGSSDSYESVLSQFDRDVVKYYRLPGGGVSVARNFALEKSGNPYIAFLDDDDEWLPNHLLLQRQVFAARPDIAGIFCNFRTTDEHGRWYGNGLGRWCRNKPSITALLKRALVIAGDPPVDVYIGEHYGNQLLTDYILPSSFSINTRVVGVGNRFKVGLKRNQTYLFNSHICSYGPVAFIDTETCIQHGDAPVRATGIHEFDNVFSRLIVMSEEWGSNTQFLRNNRALYEKTFLMDFALAFKVALREPSLGRIRRLLGLVGLRRFLSLGFRAIPLVLRPSRIERRVT